jgi:transcription termination factor Rho
MAVLQRTELESSPLADLHAIASELGIEGFRAKRKDDLIGAILAAQGGEEPEDEREPDLEFNGTIHPKVPLRAAFSPAAL